MVYVLHLDELERHFHTAVLAASTARAAGAEDAKIPSWTRIRTEFDTWLASEPVELADDDETVMLRALGLR